MLNSILKTPYKRGDRRRFSRMCLTWNSLNLGVSRLDKGEVCALLRFLKETRPNNKTYITRVVARFNALNKLTVEDLCDEECNEGEHGREEPDVGDTGS